MFQIEEDDHLPKVLCYRCMYNLENFYDFRTACVNASAWLERNRPKEGVSVSIRWNEYLISDFVLDSKISSELRRNRAISYFLFSV